ncbi:MAG TPA: hypothetical protein PLK67_02230 [Bryobacteraceae bacterium]|nr:hypothetical protein [Bryobacteraceae bacterium]HOL70350.1 hypothetical protein [Bryobacteraceae bacterium]
MTPCVKATLVVLAAAGMASSGTVSCPPPPDPGVSMSVVGMAAYCGGITFSNFQAMPFRNDNSFRMFDGPVRPGDRWASLASNLGPQRIQPFSNPDGDERDESRVVRQSACSSLVVSSGREADCPKSVLPAGFFTAHNSRARKEDEQPKWTWPEKKDAKDAFHSPDSKIPKGSHEPFHGSDVPEPAAFLLAGPVLLGLFALRRRRVAPRA